MEIWRIEHRTQNTGPFMTPGSVAPMCEATDTSLLWNICKDLNHYYSQRDYRNHPQPKIRPGYIPYCMFCGVLSFDEIFHWFVGDSLAKLKECGFVLRCFKIDSVFYQDESQVMFDRGDATLIEEIEL